MFTDMVGYTAITQSNETQAMEVLDRHHRLLRPFFPKFSGREVKTIGDSFLVEFDSALDATRCAVEIQSYLHDYNLTSKEEWKISLRIGIHLGDVIHQEGDVFGDAVNIASRIEPLAPAEGVVISEQVYDQVHNKFVLPLIPMGEKSLKNVSRPVQIYSIQMPWEREKPSERTELDSKRIAVLPFASVSPDPNDEYFTDGLTEELITKISLVKGLEVIARTSAMNYKREKKNASQIGKELKVGTLLEGSVRKVGNRIRVSAQLINTNNEAHLWAETYDRNLDDIFAVQSDVAEKVASSLEVKLTQQVRETLRRAETPSPEAHILYLKGEFHARRWEKGELLESIRLFKEALALDEKYALVYSGLASSYERLGFLDLVEPKEAFEMSRAYARKALELDETLPGPHIVLSVVLQHDYDFKGAAEEVETAIKLDPNYVDAYRVLSSLYAFLGRTEDSLKCADKELELDPVSAESAGDAGTCYLYAKRYDEAIKLLKDAMELDPTNWFDLDNLGLAHIQKGMLEEGLSEVRKAYEMSKGSAHDLAYAYVKAGKHEEARQLLASLLKGEQVEASSTDLAGIYAALGENDKALDLLERAYEERSGYLTAVFTDFVFDGLRGEPRFHALMEKIGLNRPD
jgi:TolB-like protein/Flp pilus assembly protein TadD